MFISQFIRSFPANRNLFYDLLLVVTYYIIKGCFHSFHAHITLEEAQRVEGIIVLSLLLYITRKTWMWIKYGFNFGSLTRQQTTVCNVFCSRSLPPRTVRLLLFFSLPIFFYCGVLYGQQYFLKNFDRQKFFRH